MHPAGLVIIFWIIRAFMNRNGQTGRPVGTAATTFIHQEISFRFVLLAAFVISAYAFLAFRFYVGLEQALTPVIPIPMLRNVLEDIGAGVLPFVIVRTTPPWLAWRVCRPLGIPFLSRFFYWFTPGADVRELENFATLLRSTRGVAPTPPPAEKNGMKEKVLRFFLLYRKPQPFTADAWTVAAMALAAEVQGDFGRAERLIHTFDLCPPGMKTTTILRDFVFEELGWLAAERGDWYAVRHRAQLGFGRGMPLLKLLAKMHLTHKVNRALLWLAWLLSPSRVRALPLVLAATKATVATSTGGNQQLQQYVNIDPRPTHLRLLLLASEGTPIVMGEVFDLARMWDGELTHQGEENLLRRGVELRARDVLGIARKISDSLLDELEELAATAEGHIPEWVLQQIDEGESSCATKLILLLRNRLYEHIYRAQELFHVEDDERLADERMLEHWEIWLDLHTAVSRLHSLFGTDELATVWYGGLRTEAWNSASNIFNSCGGRTAWISILMFQWVAEVSELVGDEEGATSNRNNMKICGYSPSLSQQFFHWVSSLRFFLVGFQKKLGL